MATWRGAFSSLLLRIGRGALEPRAPMIAGVRARENKPACVPAFASAGWRLGGGGGHSGAVESSATSGIWGECAKGNPRR